MALMGNGMLQVIFVLGILLGISNSRIVRGATIAIKENMYMEAARAIGSSTTRLLVRHTLPNISAPIIVMFTISVGGMILAEATLSFLGFGIPPPAPSWGGMLSGSGRNYMFIAPWLAIWPGIALGLAVYGINMLGDAVRDILDPRLRGGIGRYGRHARAGKNKVLKTTKD
jgi:peptide/nickel transport system permease protein